MSEHNSVDPSAHAWQLAQQVIELTRGLIVSDHPFLSTSMALLKPQPATLPDVFATDGVTLYVDVSRLLRAFAQSRTAPTHDLAHVLFHGILLHPFVDGSVDAAAWDLACDIVAEGLAAELLGPRPDERGKLIRDALRELEKGRESRLTTERLYRALCDGSHADWRRAWVRLFHVDDHSLWPPSSAAAGGGEARGGSEGASDGSTGDASGDPMGASGEQANIGGEQAGTRDKQTNADSGPTNADSSPAAGDNKQASTPDAAVDTLDAAASPSSENGAQGLGEGANPGTSPTFDAPPAPTLSPAELKRAEQAWERAAKSMRLELETLSRSRGAGLGKLVRELEVSAHERIDYRSFLRQFAVEHEDMRLSDDEFDYIFYTYGLELYGNVPLVEPLEYRNEKRIRDFAIVIDTSSSVSAKVVQEFVNTTFDVLSSEGSFFAQTNIHIIQADARVQSDAKISSLADLDRWRRTIKLQGFGGTDFRPAFRYVQQLQELGEFDDLQGLIYFTDGWGIYPERMPPYSCAFVFYDEDHRPDLVPPWAIQVVLHPGEFESMSVY